MKKEKKEKKRKKRGVKVRKIEEEGLLREVIVKIGLDRIDMQKGITVEVLLNSKAIDLVMSLEFVRRKRFKLKKIERPIYVRNVDGMFNKEELIEHTVEVNIYYQGHRERMEIDMIEGQKWNIILQNTIACLLQF